MAENSKSKLKKGEKLTKVSTNVYLDSFDDKLVVRKTIGGKSAKVYTPFSAKQIKSARDFAEQKFIDKFSQKPDAEKRDRDGIKDPLVKDLWNECVKMRAAKRAKSTLIKYDVSWNHGFGDFFDKMTISEWNINTVNLFETWYLKNKSHRGFFNTRKHLVMLINYLWNNSYLEQLDKKPVVIDLDKEVLDYKNKKKKVGRVYSDQEIKDLLANAQPRTRLGILFARCTGARKNEFLSCKWANVDFKKGEVEIWSDKNKKWRTVPLADVLLNSLKEYKLEQKKQSEFIFYSPQNPKRYIRSQIFDKDWKRTKKKANISGWDVKNASRVHDLRHTFATQTAEEGWPVKTACELLDMSIEEYETTYTHVSTKAKSVLIKKGFAKW